jgi:PAS domain S-box-containing protein
MGSEIGGLVDALPGLVWIALPDGSCDFVNRPWCDYTGLGFEDARGHGWRSAIHPDDLFWLIERLETFLASTGRAQLEARLRRFDGEYRWFQFSVSPILDSSGQAVKWCGLASDIEESKQAETALRAHEHRSRLIIDGLPVIITLMTPEGDLEEANQHMLDYFGLPLEALKARPAGYSLHPADRAKVLGLWSQCLETGGRCDHEARLRRADGVYRWFRVRGFPLRDAQGAISAWSLLQIDIDDRKRGDALLAGERRILEMVATGEPLAKTLAELCRLAETLCPDCASSSIMLLDRQTQKLWCAAAPNVPAGYITPVDGFVIGRGTGSCGTAVQTAKQAISSDISTDPIWAEFREVALANGLRACWSTPIFSPQGHVSGAFAMFSGEAGVTPGQYDQEVIARLTHLSSIAIERERSQTSLMRAHRELEKSEFRLRTIIDTIPTSVFCSMADGADQFWNQRWRDYSGVSSDDAQSRGWQAVIHPDEMAKLAEAWEGSMASGQAGEIEVRLRRFDGEYRWFLCRWEPLRDETGRIVSWYGANTDIDDAKRAEAYLIEGQRLSLTGSFSWRVDTDEITFSEELRRIFEFEQTDVVTIERILGRTHPEDTLLLTEKIAESRRGVQNQNFDIRLVTPNHPIKYIRMFSHKISDPVSRLEYLGAVQDITERRLTEQTLSKVRAELAHVTRITSLSALTASIAHEVNQPLAGIITNAGTCLKMLDADPPNVAGARETARRTIRDGNRAADVIKRLRALFSKQGDTVEALDLNEATREVVALSRTELERKRVILRMELADDLSLVAGDRIQLQQVILNLLLNASEAMSGVEDRPRSLVIRTEQQEDQVSLSVEDVGIGFSTQDANRLFDAFYTTKYGGMGIGLHVSRSIIERHQGRLFAKPNDGPGAIFVFCLPRLAEPVTSGAYSLAAAC